MKIKGYIYTPWIIARAKMPPVLVPATQSKSSLVGRPASLSRAINIWINTRPLIPPPSRHRSRSILQRGGDGFAVSRTAIFSSKNFENTLKLKFFNSLHLHFGAIHFRLASAHCTYCSPHIHDVLKPCQPITTTIGMGPTHSIKFTCKGCQK